MSKAADLNFKSTTCRRKGRLLRFQSITSSTSDGYAQRLGNDLWNDSESIATKVCSQIGRKCRKMFESQVEVCIDLTSFNFQFKDEGVFMSNLLIIYYVTEQQSISQSRRSVLNFKFSVLTFLRSIVALEQNLCEEKRISTLIYFLCDNTDGQKVCGWRIWYVLSGLDIQNFNQRIKVLHAKNSVQASRLRKMTSSISLQVLQKINMA